MNMKIRSILFSGAMVLCISGAGSIIMPNKTFAQIIVPNKPEQACGIGSGIKGDVYGKCVNIGASMSVCDWSDSFWHQDVAGYCRGVYSAGEIAKKSNISFPGVIQTIQKNIDSLKEQIIDFLSTEETTFEEFKNSGRKAKTINIVSNYRVVNEKSESAKFNEIITQEEREVLSVKEDGKEQSIGKFTELITTRRNPYDDLFLWFDENAGKCFDYKFNGIVKVNKRDAYEVRIYPKKDINGIDKICELSDMSAEGFVFIDIKTMDILRSARRPLYYIREFEYNPFNYTPLNHPACFIKPCVYATEYVYDYDNVKIKNQVWRLPITKQVTVAVFTSNNNLQPWLVNKSRYSNHKAFIVDTKIRYDGVYD